MKAPLLLKILAVCFSLSLGCAYVGYRGTQQRATPAEPATGTEKAAARPARTVVLPSSKNIDAVLTRGSQSPSTQINRDTLNEPLKKQVDEKKPAPAPTILPSSKSGAFLVNPGELRTVVPAQQEKK